MYVKIYLELPENGNELHKCFNEYIHFYINRREHLSLDYIDTAELFKKLT